MAAPKPMTAAELILHPEYTHITWDLQPAEEGKAAVAIGRGGPINIAYEIHGHGNRHLVAPRYSIPRPLDVQISNIKGNLYTAAFLNAPDCTEYTVQPFPTNGDRFAATEVSKRTNPVYFTRHGFIAQAIAAGWHYKSPTQLKQIAERVGRRRIMCVHGSEDRMITFPHAGVLWEGLNGGTEEGDDSGVEKHFVMGQGHVIPVEMRKEFMGWLEGLIERAEELNKSSS